VPGDPYSRGEHFLAEAERLWRAEEGNASISSIQGLLLLLLLYVFGVGDAYLVDINDLLLTDIECTARIFEEDTMSAGCC
jgi:hypothetical protein